MLYAAGDVNLWTGEHRLPLQAMFSSAERPETVLQQTKVDGAGVYFVLRMLPSFEGHIYAAAPCSGVSLLAAHTA